MSAPEQLLDDQLLAMALHDLRKSVQPVRSVLAVVLGERAGQLTPAQHEFLTIAEQASRRLSRLIDDVEVALENGHQRPLCLERVDLVEVVRRCLDEFRLCAQSRQIEISCRCTLPTLEFKADVQSIEQIMMNLLDNAIHYTASPAVVRVRVCSSASYVAIRVDNPIAAEQAGDPVAWVQPGARGQSGMQPDGRGLGLAVVKRLAERHGGKLVTRVTCDSVSMCIVFRRNARIDARTIDQLLPGVSEQIQLGSEPTSILTNSL